MKKFIEGILRRGYTHTAKYSLEDYIKYLYPLQHILQYSPAGFVSCNNNKFWRPENNQNRIELFYDVCGMRKAKPTDNCYFRIINRFENGDKYGIVVE